MIDRSLERPPARRPGRGNQGPTLRCRLTGGLALLWLSLAACSHASAAPPPGKLPLRRAYVPLDAAAQWPAGDWKAVPMPVLRDFLRDESSPTQRVLPMAYIEQAQFQGTMTADLALEGTWSASVRCPDGSRPLIELGDLSPVLKDLKLGDGPAVWGSDPFGRTLLYVDRPTGDLSGQWSLAGSSIIDRVEFEVRLPPSATTRCELTIPAGWRLRSSAGFVREPEPAETDGWTRWTIDLGQHRECLWTLQKTDAQAGPRLACDRTIVYAIRPDGNRVQADFTVQAFDQPATEITFVLPDELSNPTVTYATGTGLAIRIIPEGDQQRVIVPLRNTDPGRLGTFRISADLPPGLDAHAPLPVVSLAGAEILHGSRRIDVDRPLTLRSLDVDGLRQSAVNSDDLRTNWFFEELRPDGQIVVRVGRPQTSLTANLATHLEWTHDGPRFHSVVSLQARTGNTFRTHFRLPPGCDIVDVFPSKNVADSQLSHWRVSEAGEAQLLTVEFREALQVQSPKQFELTGRWTNTSPVLRVSAFPVPVEADDWQILLAINPGSDGSVAAAAGALRPIAGGQVPSNWSAHQQVLGIAIADPELTWFEADGASPPCEIMINSAAAASPPPAFSAAARRVPGEPESTTLSPASEVPVLSLELHSLISAAASTPQWHEARYKLSGMSGQGDWTFDLPEPAILDAVFVDGRGHPTEVLGQSVQLAPLPPDAHEILIRYRTPMAAGGGWLRSRYQVPLPRWSIPVVSLKWQVGLPRGYSVAGCPLESPVGSFAAEPSWLPQIFWPWSRSVSTPRFDPFSRQAWRNLLAESGPMGGPESDSAPDVAYVSLEPPSALALDVWDVPTASRLAQVLLMACLTCVVISRRVVGPHARPLVATTAATVFIAALCVPVEYVPIAGGSLLGLVIGGLLPSTWVRQRDLLAAWQFRRHAALTPGAVSVLALVGFCLWYAPTRAQESNSSPPKSDVPAPSSTGSLPQTTEFDVLIPYRDDAAAPLGFINARILPAFVDWLQREHELPPYLLRSVQYQISDSDPAMIRAVTDVVVLSESPRVPVVLPFREITFRSPDNCEVDGRRTQVRPVAGDNGFVVEIGPLRTVDETGPGAGTSAKQRRVEIAVWFQMGGANGGGGYRCRVPPINSACLDLPATLMDRGLRPAPVQGARHRDEHGGVEFDLGGVQWIGIEPVSAEDTVDTPRSPLRVDATTLIEVHPMRLLARSRMEVSPRSEESGIPLPRRLNLLLPGRVDVRQVSAENLREFNVWHSGATVTVLEADFSQRLAARQTIEFDYTIPFDPVSAAEIPAIRLVDGDQLLRHRIGLRAAPGLVLEVDRAALVAGRLQELLPDLPLETGSSPPDAVFAALKPTPIPVHLAPLESNRSVAAEQRVTIESHALRLEVQAHLEISGIPVFEHQLRLPHNLRIDTIKVEQDAANRLLDWSRDGDHLVVHLREGRSGQQLLKLWGWLPLQPGEITRIPSLSFDDATIRSSELILANKSGESVALFAKDGSPVLPGFSAPTTSTEAAVKRYAGPGPVVPVSCRLEARSTEPLLQSVVFLQQEGQILDLAMACRVEQPAAAAQSELTLSVPHELAPQFQVRPESIVKASRIMPDGSLEMQLQLSDTGAAVEEFELAASLTPPGQSRWTLPLPGFSRVSGDQRVLVLPPDFGFEPVASSAVRSDSADWSSGRGAGSVHPVTGSTSYRITADSVVMVPTGTISPTPADPAFVETVVWNQVDGSALGLTTAYLAAVNRQIELELVLPDAARILQVLDGDHAIETDTNDPSTVACVIHANDDSQPRRVAFLWRRGVADSDRMLTSTTSLPDLRGLSPEHNFVIVVPPHGQQYVLRDKAQLRTSDHYRLERAEQLVQLLEGHVDVDSRSSAASPIELTGDLNAAVAVLSRVAWSDDRFARRFAALESRWATVRATAGFDSAPVSFPDSAYRAEVNDQRQMVSDALSNPDALPLRPVPGKQQLDFWSVREQVVRTGCGILSALALLLLLIAGRNLRRRWEAPELWAQVEYLGLVLFGLFWWFALRFGAIGLLLSVGAVALQVAAWLRKPPAAIPSPQ